MPETICPDCASTSVVVSTVKYQMICRDCGLIFEPLVPEQGVPQPTSAKKTGQHKKK